MSPRHALASLALVLPIAAGAVLADDMVAKSAAETKPIKVGTKAPDAAWRGTDGKSTSLKQVTAGKPTVLIFYRGSWCPFCNAHLSDLARVEGQLRSMGYQIVAVSPDKPEKLKPMEDKDKLTYRLYSDTTAETFKKFGVAFRVDDGTYDKYKNSFKLDLEKESGATHHILPVPSVFLLDKSGKIVFEYTNPDYKIRMKGDDIVAAAKSAK
ncbi:MAG: AhpC/TSA family protein [Armatimonadetes bacterium]|nr:AhpC/TSA family protein [Armatimonadota bacterium]